MSDKKYNLNGRRFRFKRDNLTERPSIEQTALGFTKSDTGVNSYMGAFEEYLRNLIHNSKKEAECPLCAFDIELPEKAYYSSKGMEKFVADEETHRSLCESGHILTYNPDGWHLINELFFPRVHKPIPEYVKASLESVISHSFDRWDRHQSGLRSFNITGSYYHGLVVNSGYGQSVSHGHIHCYTSSYSRKYYEGQRDKLTQIRILGSEAVVWLVPFDHPRMIFDFDFNDRDRDILSDIIGTIINIGLECYWRLFEFEFPHCLGVFLNQSFTEGSVMIHPMQRRGTIQEFQNLTFHQFSVNSILSDFRPIISDIISGLGGIEEV